MFSDLKYTTIWKTTGNFYAPEGQETHEINGAGFRFRFGGPEEFDDARKLAEKFARKESDCPDDFTLQISELIREETVYCE